MQTRPSGLWPLRLSTLALAALAAASATFWALKWSVPATWQSSLAPTAASTAPTDTQAIARLLGAGAADAGVAATAPESLSSRFKLTGVIADRAHRGYAVIAVDGQSAKPFGVGSLVAQGLVLQSVSARGAVLAASRKGPAALTLELPPLDKPLDRPLEKP